MKKVWRIQFWICYVLSAYCTSERKYPVGFVLAMWIIFKGNTVLELLTYKQELKYVSRYSAKGEYVGGKEKGQHRNLNNSIISGMGRGSRD